MAGGAGPRSPRAFRRTSFGAASSASATTNSLRLRQGIVNGELYWSTVYESSAASRPSFIRTSASFERWRSISSGVATPGNGKATTVRARLRQDEGHHSVDHLDGHRHGHGLLFRILAEQIGGQNVERVAVRSFFIQFSDGVGLVGAHLAVAEGLLDFVFRRLEALGRAP